MRHTKLLPLLKESKNLSEASYTRVTDTYNELANLISGKTLIEKIERLKDTNSKKAKELDKKLNAALGMLKNL